MSRIAVTLPMSTKVLLLMAVCAAAAPLSSQVAVINGGFETGGLIGWTLVGPGYAAVSGIGVTPPEGSFQGYIETTGNYSATAQGNRMLILGKACDLHSRMRPRSSHRVCVCRECLL